MKYFISHSSEDRDTFVREFADKMILNDMHVFYDEYSINLGDSIVDSINKGISRADAGIIVLSKNFFKKKWPQSELNSLFSKLQTDSFKIIPLFHNISPEEVYDNYPLISDIKGIRSSEV